MTREEYEESKQQLLALREDKLTYAKELSELRSEYIDANKPYEKGQKVEIVLASGRKVRGTIESFSIFFDGNVYVDCYRDNYLRKYISTPYQSIVDIC